MEKEFREIAGVLKEAKRRGFILDYALTGALALSALSQPRATRDMDFIISVEKEKLPFFVDWLKSNKGFNLTKHHTGRPKDWVKDLIEVPMGNTWADILVAHHDIEKDALSQSIPISSYGNLKIKVVRPEHLIVLKLLAGSEQDYIDAAHLWNGQVDKKFVRAAAKKLFIENKIKRLVLLSRRLSKSV